MLTIMRVSIKVCAVVVVVVVVKVVVVMVVFLGACFFESYLVKIN